MQFLSFIFNLVRKVAKWVFHSAVRRATNLFGVFGTAKKLTKAIVKNKFWKTVKDLAKKNILRSLHSANVIRNFYKFGAKETLKRAFMNRFIPMEFRKFKWFINSFKQQTNLSKRKYYSNHKNTFWKIIDKQRNQREQAGKLDFMVKWRPKTEQEKEAKQTMLDKTFWFKVKSPEMHCFDKLPQFANLTKKTYGVPIKSGIFDNYIRYYHFDDLGGKHWPIVKEAMTTDNYGRNVYSQIRGPIPDEIIGIIARKVYNN